MTCPRQVNVARLFAPPSVGAHISLATSLSALGGFDFIYKLVPGSSAFARLPPRSLVLGQRRPFPEWPASLDCRSLVPLYKVTSQGRARVASAPLTCPEAAASIPRMLAGRSTAFCADGSGYLSRSFVAGKLLTRLSRVGGEHSPNAHRSLGICLLVPSQTLPRFQPVRLPTLNYLRNKIIPDKNRGLFYFVSSP